MPRKTKAQLEAELLDQQKSAEEAEVSQSDEAPPSRPPEGSEEALTAGGPSDIRQTAVSHPDGAAADDTAAKEGPGMETAENDPEDGPADLPPQTDADLKGEPLPAETKAGGIPLDMQLPEPETGEEPHDVEAPPPYGIPTEMPEIETGGGPAANAGPWDFADLEAQNAIEPDLLPENTPSGGKLPPGAGGWPTEEGIALPAVLSAVDGVLPVRPDEEDRLEEELPEEEPALLEEKPAPVKKEPSAEDLKREEAQRLRAQRRSDFFHINFKEVDRDLSPDQLQEWQAIYASYRSQSILTGEVTGVDSNTFMMPNPETGQMEKREICSLIVINYRVKVLIPETELWFPGEERPSHVVRSMIGTKVDYVIQEVDRGGECAIGSRTAALRKQRRRTINAYRDQAGAHVTCRVLVVGPKSCLVGWGGFDVNLAQRHLSYTAIADLRTEYHAGQELEAVFRGFYPETGRPLLSVKAVNPNPYDGAEVRHPPGSRRQAVISGKYAGGIFCTMKDGVTCLCLYSNNHYDTQFAVGDSVLIRINFYDDERKLIYARILAKW